MKPAPVRVFDTPAALAAAVADAFVADAMTAIRERGVFFAALAGGTTPKAAYALLAQEPRRSRVDWNRVQVFFGDERSAGPDDPDSNFRMARESLLGAVDIPESNVHRMRGEADPAEAAREYADLLIEFLGDDPRFDLILLGMGPDGHTASLFPGADPRTDDSQLVRAVWVEKMQTHRITITPSVINNARHVIIATEGTAKAEMFRTVRESAPDPVKYPVQVVAPHDGSIEWYVDAAAAGRHD